MKGKNCNQKTYLGLFFVADGSLAENVQSLQFLSIQQFGTVFNVSLLLELLLFLFVKTI